MDLYFRVSEAAAVLRELLGDRRPRIAVVLGSALGAAADVATDVESIPFEKIPGFRSPTTSGHSGSLLSGTIAGQCAVLLSGRIHAYEGYTLEDVTFPMRALAAIGVEIVVLTNSAGGISKDYAVGDIVALEDHINLTGQNALTGPNDERLGPRFPDMTKVYDRQLLSALDTAAVALGWPLRRGVYAGVAGPSFETPAEIRMIETLGATLVGMSTVHEATIARHAGLRVAGLSCVANAAAGKTAAFLSHEEVLETGRRSAAKLGALLEAAVPKLTPSRSR